MKTRPLDTPRQLNLNLFIYPGGHHEAAWRYRQYTRDRADLVTGSA